PFLSSIARPGLHSFPTRRSSDLSVCVVLGISSGASIGGWLSEYHGWRSIFYFSLPIAGFILLTMAVLLPETKAPQSSAFDFFGLDRKSTRLNSSHDQNSYAVFCL